MISFQGKPFKITVIQVYAPISNAKETEVVQFYEDLQFRPSRTNTKEANVEQFYEDLQDLLE